MSKRTDYQRVYMRSYRAKQREAGATAIHANPMIESGGAGLNDRQLGQQRPANARRYGLDACRYAALSAKRKTARRLAKQKGGLSSGTGMDVDGIR